MATMNAGAGNGSMQAAAPADMPEIPEHGVAFDHAVMNLPASAVEFLDAFNGAFCPGTWRDRRLPLVHVYTFARADETDRGAMQRLRF